MTTNKRFGDWMQTTNGTQFWPLDPRAGDINIEEIAISLAKQCRYAGHTKGFLHYSVAEHCCHISDLCPPEHKLWGLLHDASEAYIVDVPRPIKLLLQNYKQIESELMKVICRRFDLPLDMPQIVHELDGRILVNEREQVMAKPPVPWSDTRPRIDGLTIHCWESRKAYDEFMRRFEALH